MDSPMCEEYGLQTTMERYMRAGDVPSSGWDRGTQERLELTGNRQYDLNSDLPLGPPQLMMAYTAADQVNKSLLQQRDE